MQHRITTGLAASILAATYFAPIPKERGAKSSVSVTAIHDELFAALDRADVKAVRELLTIDAVLCVVDPNGQPVSLDGSSSAQSLVSLWSRGIEDPAPTKILSSSVVAESPSSTVVVLELERPTNDLPYFRATSVVVKKKTATGPKTRIQHLHVSPASREDWK